MKKLFTLSLVIIYSVCYSQLPLDKAKTKNFIGKWYTKNVDLKTNDEVTFYKKQTDESMVRWDFMKNEVLERIGRETPQQNDTSDCIWDFYTDTHNIKITQKITFNGNLKGMFAVKMYTFHVDSLFEDKIVAHYKEDPKGNQRPPDRMPK